jgi:hypothetical protein
MINNGGQSISTSAVSSAPMTTAPTGFLGGIDMTTAIAMAVMVSAFTRR